MLEHLSFRVLLRTALWVWLLSGCNAAQRQEAKTAVCNVCKRVAAYCETGDPLAEEDKKAILNELYPDAGAPDAAP